MHKQVKCDVCKKEITSKSDLQVIQFGRRKRFAPLPYCRACSEKMISESNEKQPPIILNSAAFKFKIGIFIIIALIFYALLAISVFVQHMTLYPWAYFVIGFVMLGLFIGISMVAYSFFAYERNIKP